MKNLKEGIQGYHPSFKSKDFSFTCIYICIYICEIQSTLFQYIEFGVHTTLALR